MEDIRAQVVDKSNTQENVAQFVKLKLLEYSKPSQRSPSPTQSVFADDDDTASVMSSSRPKTNTAKLPARPTSKTGKKKTKEQEEQERLQKEEEERQRQVEEEKQRKAEEAARTPIFNVEEIGAIMHFVTSGILQHYRLYVFVFNQEQPRDVHKYNLDISTPASTIAIMSMLDHDEFNDKLRLESEEREYQEKQRKDEELRLVKEAEEAARVKYEKEEEELNAPKLTAEQLQEIADYLRYHMKADISGKRDELIERVADIQMKVDAMNRPKSKQEKKGAAPKKK